MVMAAIPVVTATAWAQPSRSHSTASSSSVFGFALRV